MNNKNLKEAEVSPDGRYVRFDEKLGNGAYKEVFLSYDTETGKEVAWNTVTLARLPPTEKKRIRMETDILKDLDHPHIINFYHVWENPAKDQICFTTEIVTSGTLKQYVNRVRNVKLKVIKKWCRQILTALDYLHCHQPPIIHRDLKCDNVFINGGTGEIRIGDFGLSAARHTTHVESVLGTPEFMAPELYDENYSEKVDIYAFGMCVLEMTTKEYPYEECSNAAQIWKKVSMGQKPEVLGRILNKEVRAFIEMCLMPAEMRLSARELLKHPFLKFKRSDPSHDEIIALVEPRVSPTHRESQQSQRDQLKQAIDARGKEKEASSHAQGRGHPVNNYSLDGPDALISPSTSSRSHHPPTINTHVSQTSHLYDNQTTPLHDPHYQHHHQPAAPTSHHPSPAAHHPPQQTAQTPPVRFSRQASHPNLAVHGGLTHSQSTQAFPQPQPQSHAHGSLHHPQPQRAGSMLSTPSPQGAAPAVSPDLVHVSTVVVEVESTHSHFANITLHIHFEAGTRRKKQIRFQFDYNRDTSESVAGEMVKALKLPDQERTANMVASAMELKIQPLRHEYYRTHGAATVQSANVANVIGPQFDAQSPASSPHVNSSSLQQRQNAPHDHPPPHPKQGPHHNATMQPPQPPHTTKAQYHNNTMPNPKLSSAQPTNVGTGSRLPQQQSAPNVSRPSTASNSGNSTGGSRRHSHDQAVNNLVDPLAMNPVTRTVSIPVNLGAATGSHQQSLSQMLHQAHLNPPNAQTFVGPLQGNNNAAGGGENINVTGPSALRRSSSTSSLAFMRTPEEAALKKHHDRLYEEYKMLSVAVLKERIKERMKQNPATDSNVESEAVGLSGILEKKDLIESLIRLTPRVMPGDAVQPPSHPHHGSHHHHHHHTPSPHQHHSNHSHHSHHHHSPQTHHHHHTLSGHSQHNPSSSPPSPPNHRFEIQYLDQSHPPSDSSAASTPRVQSNQSGTATPAELRSRTHSIDATDSAFFASVNSAIQSKNGGAAAAVARVSDSHHHHSPSASPSQSPLPSPVARHDELHHHAPSSHRHVQESYKDGSGSGHSVSSGLGPSPLIRSTSSPHDLPGSQSRKVLHAATDPNTGAVGAKNFTFPSTAAASSGHTSPASTNSNLSYASSVGGHIDLDELANVHTVTGFPATLHVDVNPLSPPVSAPHSASADISSSPAVQPRSTLAPHGPSTVSTPPASSHSIAPASATSHPTHAFLNPQSPTIPEETGNEDMSDSAHSSSTTLPHKQYHGDADDHQLHPPPSMNKAAAVGPHPNSNRSNSVILPNKPLPPFTTPHAAETVNPPLAAKKPQYSASVDDLSKFNAPIKSSPSGPGTPASATPHLSSLRTNSMPDYSSFPAFNNSSTTSLTPNARSGSSSSTSSSTGPVLHQRAHSVFVGSSDDMLETEEKRRARLEAAERSRLQKKNDAAKAAKMCEDKILSGLTGGNFSLH